MQDDAKQTEAPSAEIEETMRNFVSAVRAVKLYPPNNPVYSQSVRKSFESLSRFLDTAPRYFVGVQKTYFLFEQMPVAKETQLNKTIAQDLFGRGVREIVFLPGLLACGHEGIMAKALDAPYAAGSRGSAWLKIKAAHTLDLVVLAGEWGSGRRRGSLSNLHLGARDPEGNAFVMLGKTFKGLTDEMLAWQTRELLAREIAPEGHVVHVRPELVVEVAFNDLQKSPRYPGGFTLRFARVKQYRTDKTADQCDTFATVAALKRREWHES